ncbi:MAG TPA: PAS domain S-box protein [Rubrobacter sp.]|nr:PAS domain S-box protein [Rubrobacter sp.]
MAKGDMHPRGAGELRWRGDAHPLFRFASDIFSVLEVDGTIRYESPAIEEVLGYRPDELVGQNAFSYVHPEDLEEVIDAFVEGIMDTGSTRRVEFRFRHSDGSWRHLEGVGVNLLDEPRIKGIVVTSRDVSERKMAEEELRESEARYRAVIEQSMDGIYLLDAGSRRILETNSALREMLGYSAAELRGMELYDISAHTREDIDSNLERTLAEKSRFVGEQEYRRKDGSVVDVEVGVSVIHYGGSEMLCVVVRDVGARKRVEEALRSSESRLAAAQQLVHVGSWEHLVAEERFHWSDELYRIFGFEPGTFEPTYETFIERIHPEDRGFLQRTVGEAIRDGKQPAFECRVVRPDGEVRVAQCQYEIEYGAKGELVRMSGAVQDITERKRTEEALRDAEARFRTLVEQVPATIYVEDLSSNGKTLTYISPHYEEMLGYAPQEGMSHPEHWIELVHPEDRELVLAEDARTDETGDPFAAEYRMFAKDGSVVWIRDEAVLVHDDEGRPLFWQGVMLDITGRKEAESRLREAEELYRTLVERIPAVTYVDRTDDTDEPLYVSPQIEELLGYTPEEWLKGRLWIEHLHHEDRARITAANERFEAGEEEFYSEEYRLIAKDESVVWVREEAVLVRDEEGEQRFRQGVFLDITGRKEAEQALRGSEARFRSVIESVGEGLLITDERDVVLYVNPRMTELTGYSEEEMLDHPAYELFLPPEDWPEMMQRNRRRTEGSPERYEIRLKRRDGGTFWAEISATPYRDVSGKVVGTLGALTDITERKLTERSLEESEQRFRQLFEQSVDALFVHDERGRFVDCNSQATRLLGYSREELLSMSVWDVSEDMLTPEDKARKEREGGTLWQRALGGAPGTFALSHEEMNRRKDGTSFPVEVRVGSVDYGGRRMLLTSVRDITQRKLAEEELRKSEGRHRRQARELSLLYKVSTALAQELDLSAILRTVVDAVAGSFGYTQVSAYELEGDVLKLRHQVGYDEVIERIPSSRGVSGRVVRTGRPVLLEDVREDPDFLGAIGGITSEVCVPLFDQDTVVGVLNVESVGGVKLTPADLRLTSALGEQASIAISRARLYEQDQESKQQLAHQAFHDSLTGLANRNLLMDRLGHAQARVLRRTEVLAVLFMDLDDFKIINDSLGHAVGDRLLVAVAECLKSCVRPQDTISRLGGDEFVALLEDLRDEGDAVRVAERIIERLQVPFAIDGNKLHTSISVGIAFSSAPTRDLLRAADTAMYRAKENGKGRYEVFEQDMHHKALMRLQLENDLRTALDTGGLVVYYQPEVDPRTGQVEGFEALLRWRHPERGMVLPREFLPLAEQTGLIVPVGAWVLREACLQVRAWQEAREDATPLQLSVNLSVQQLKQIDFVAEVLDETGLAPGDLVLEITEDAVMEDARYAIGALEELKSMGVRLAIDDFGTGRSSLAYLKRLPVDYLKIDRSFVERLGEDPKGIEIVSGTLALARALNLKTIAEGVETPAQLERLKEMGCDLAQGNLFSEPLGAEEAIRYLEKGWSILDVRRTPTT